MEVHAAVSPDDSSWTVLDYIFGTDEALVKTNNNTSGFNGTIQQFGGFRTYYVPVDYKGQKFGFETESTSQVEIRYGFCRYPTIGEGCIVQGVETSSEIGSFYKNNTIVSPIDIGFFAVSVYNYNNLEDIVIYSRETTADIVANSTETIINNQEQNTQQILQSQEEMTDRITEGQNQISNDLTNTDFNEDTISVDTSSLDDLDENEDILNYPMQLVQKLLDIVNSSNWSTVQTVDIGLPYTDNKIQLRSDMLSNFIKDTPLEGLIETFWIFVFGRYMIHFGLRIYHWLRTGEAVRKSFNIDNEAITAALM